MEMTQTTNGAIARPGLQTVAQLHQHPVVRQLLVMAGIAASVAIGVAVVLWTQAPSYSLLYGNLGEKGGQEVMEALQKANLEYRAFLFL